MTSSERKALEPFLREVATGPVRSTAVQAAALLKRFSRGRKPMPPRKVEKNAARAARRDLTKVIRAAVFARAENHCEFCWVRPPAEMHHLESGVGRRLQLQSVNNCMAICATCHRGYHSDPASCRSAVLKWAERYGYPVPSRFRSAA